MASALGAERDKAEEEEQHTQQPQSNYLPQRRAPASELGQRRIAPVEALVHRTPPLNGSSVARARRGDWGGRGPRR